MKQREIMLNTKESEIVFDELKDILSEDHIGTSIETPLRADAFDLSDKKKIEK